MGHLLMPLKGTLSPLKLKPLSRMMFESELRFYKHSLKKLYIENSTMTSFNLSLQNFRPLPKKHKTSSTKLYNNGNLMLNKDFSQLEEILEMMSNEVKMTSNYKSKWIWFLGPSFKGNLMLRRNFPLILDLQTSMYFDLSYLFLHPLLLARELFHWLSSLLHLFWQNSLSLLPINISQRLYIYDISITLKRLLIWSSTQCNSIPPLKNHYLILSGRILSQTNISILKLFMDRWKLVMTTRINWRNFMMTTFLSKGRIVWRRN